MGDLPPLVDLSPLSKKNQSPSGVLSQKGQWSSVVKDPASSLVHFSPDFVVKDGVAEVLIPTESMEDVELLWRCCVMGYFVSDAPHIGKIHATVNRIWTNHEKQANVDVQFLNSTTVLFIIENPQI